jgi:hypothetical protein
MKTPLAQAFSDMGACVARTVLSPHYYAGPWFVTFRGKRRVCANYTTAEAWANYLHRQGFPYTRDDISIGKVAL